MVLMSPGTLLPRAGSLHHGRNADATAGLDERAHVLRPRALVEVDRQEPAGFVFKQLGTLSANRQRYPGLLRDAAAESNALRSVGLSARPRISETPSRKSPSEDTLGGVPRGPV